MEDWTGVLYSVRLRAEASCPGLRAWALFPHCGPGPPLPALPPQPFDLPPTLPKSSFVWLLSLRCSHSLPCFSLMPGNKCKNNISKILKINADEIMVLFSWDVSRQ